LKRAGTSHGRRARVPQAFFSYPPAAACSSGRFAQISLSWSFWVQAALMVACIAASRADRRACLRTHARAGDPGGLRWAPTTASVVLGQKRAFRVAAGDGCDLGIGHRSAVAGRSCGRPVVVQAHSRLGFVALFAIRGRWRELGVALAAGGVTFLLSVAAAGGDWNWLATWPRRRSGVASRRRGSERRQGDQPARAPGAAARAVGRASSRGSGSGRGGVAGATAGRNRRGCQPRPVCWGLLRGPRAWG